MGMDINARRQLARRIVITLAAWVAAYLLVTLVFVVGGDQLAGAPAPVRFLVVSGVLVIVMVNVLMPFLGRTVGRLFSRA
jgi:hypothetical protein